jgi:hypothetical protein
LGLKNKHFRSHNLRYKNLNKTSIGIELDAWGGLKYRDGNWYASPNKFGTGNKRFKSGNKVKVIVPSYEVIIYKDNYRGYEGFQAYTNEQIDSAMQLLTYWNKRYKIPLNYNANMFEVNKEALSGKPGVWTHTSFRPDKSDCHPQLELITALKGLV